MDYSYYAGPQPQPFTAYGLPNPEQPTNAQSHAFAPLNDYEQNFSGFDPSLRLDPTSSFVPPSHSPTESYTKHSASSSDIANYQHTGATSLDGDEFQSADPPLVRSSSEEKELDPAQNKRKAQNRAAQRAFRERKERHARELEDKVNDLEQASKTLEADNERLKRELARYATENEILRATSQHPHSAPVNVHQDPEPTITGPMIYSPTDLHSEPSPDGIPRSQGMHHRLTVCPVTGEKLLDSGATWEFIQQHELFKRGQVDIADIFKRLTGASQCDGQGPAFKEGQVRQAIEESAAMGRDELI